MARIVIPKKPDFKAEWLNNWRNRDVLAHTRLKKIVLPVLRETATIAEISRLYKLNRNTVRKWVDRYRENGILGLYDRAPGPQTPEFRIPKEVEKYLVDLKNRKMHLTTTDLIQNMRKYRNGYFVKKYPRLKERIPQQTVYSLLERNEVFL
ncbi:MAG: hypothetical protein A2X94_13575 [Bdellovibrionales bacterium GWB1_55_8]|nr:MAG: hypothetical protein A2X94_13575 [Bdellovibrionales bacterium GWB1_55_8]